MSGINGESRHCPADVIEFTWNVVIELKTAKETNSFIKCLYYGGRQSNLYLLVACSAITSSK